MNSIKNSPLKRKYPQHELMLKLSNDLNLQNRLKLAEIGKYRRYIKNNNLIELVYKFSGKKHMIDKDILYSDILKQKYKDLIENPVDESVITEKSFVSPKVTTETAPSKKETVFSCNPFRITNPTNMNTLERNKFKAVSLKTMEVRNYQFNNKEKINISNDSLINVNHSKKHKNPNSYSFFTKTLSRKIGKSDSIETENEIKIPKLESNYTNSTFYNMKNDLQGKDFIKYEISKNTRGTTCPKIIVKKKKDYTQNVKDCNNRQMKAVCIQEFSKLNKISDSIQFALKDAKLELMNTEFFKKKPKDIKFNFNLFNRNVCKIN